MAIQRIKPRRSPSPTEQELLDNIQLHEMAYDLDTGRLWFRVDETGSFSTDFIPVDAGTLDGSTKEDIIRIASGGDPKVRAQGSFLGYLESNNFTSSLVHYSRVFLRSDHSYRWVRHFTQSSKSNVTFDVGIYTDTNREPDSLVVNSGVVTRNLLDGDFLDIELSSTFSPNISDFYWVALVNSEGHSTKATEKSVNTKLSSPPGFHPTLTEARTPSNGLPSTATPSISQIRWPWYAAVAE